MCQSWDIGLDSLYCGKWRKISKSRCDLDLDRTMPNVELFSYTTICSSFKWIEPLFLSYHVHSHTHTLTHTDRKTDRHTDKGSHSAELKKQLNRLFAKLAPSVKLNIIFSASNKLSKLCKLKCTLPIVKQSNVTYDSRGQDVIQWDLLAEIDFFVLSYSLTLSLWKKIGCHFSCQN